MSSDEGEGDGVDVDSAIQVLLRHEGVDVRQEVSFALAQHP